MKEMHQTESGIRKRLVPLIGTNQPLPGLPKGLPLHFLHDL
jgi:hypothetical protein